MIPIDGESYWLGAYEGVYEADTDCFRLWNGYREPAALSAPQRASDPARIEDMAKVMRAAEFAGYVACFAATFFSESGPKMYRLACEVADADLAYIEGTVGRIYG